MIPDIDLTIVEILRDSRLTDMNAAAIISGLDYEARLELVEALEGWERLADLADRRVQNA